MPGLRFKLWPMFGVQEVPVGAGAGGRDRRGDRAGRRPLPIGAKSAVYKPEFGNFSDLDSFVERRRAEGRAAPGAPAGHAAADPPGRVPRDHARRRSTGCRCRPTSSRQADATACSRPESFGLTPEQLQRRRDRAATVRSRRRSASSPRSRASRCRRATSRAGSAASTTSPRWRTRRGGAAAPPTPRSSRCCSAARTTCTTTTRTSRRSSTTAARSGCSTTRCSTARTC